MALQPVQYEWKREAEDGFGLRDLPFADTRRKVRSLLLGARTDAFEEPCQSVTQPPGPVVGRIRINRGASAMGDVSCVRTFG